MCISLLKPLTCTRCRHWKLHIISKAWMLDPPAILCDTFHKYIIAPWVSQVQGLSMLSTLTHTHSPPHLHLLSSVFSQRCGIKLCPQRRQRRGWPLIPQISGAHLKDPEAKTGDFRTTGIFIQLCPWLPSLSPACCYPTASPLRASRAKSEPGLSNENVHGEFTVPATVTSNN